MNSAQQDGEDHTSTGAQPTPDEVNDHKLNHDLRASLAITNGFNQALDSSFSELCISFGQLLDSQTSSTITDVELVNKVEQLEADCRFCLSRMSRSLEKLNARLDSDSRLQIQTSTSDRADGS